ncbi:MAG: GTP-binding protein [Nanoarchaeota archaeon]|nr:GTP-binding protein [Nanoarchaeota archaeon]MBU4300995.1 GTP-binding protein [Nanoarchaeota archaeon]MBU4452446.1 GTP-binding protein [Nanoarchaeota archaeon]MCG2723976.1 GTP-binding protein [archaeon]
MSVDDEIQKILDEIDKTPSNKATQGHLGKLKAKLAKLEDEKDMRKKKRSGTSTISYAVKKAGDATAVLVGFPSVGKSTLINKVTNAESKVAAYEFTTLDIIPGMLEYNGAKIQILDIPGIIEDASFGKGFGKKVLSVARNANLILLVVDAAIKPRLQIDILKKELQNIGIRFNQKKPDVLIETKPYGGVTINCAMKLTKISEDMIIAIMNEYNLRNADILIKSDITPEELIDVITANRIYLPLVIVANKVDAVENIESVRKEIGEDCVFISADKGIGLEELKKKMFENLGIIRINLKQPGKPADMKQPLILRKNSTVMGVCEHIHKDLAKNFLVAHIWGKSVKFAGQQVGAKHIVFDGDIVEIVMRK